MKALQKTLEKSGEECEGLRGELEGLRKRLEEEDRGEVVASLRGKVRRAQDVRTPEDLFSFVSGGCWNTLIHAFFVLVQIACLFSS